MNNLPNLLAGGLVALLAAVPAAAADGTAAHWGYDGDAAPPHWAALDPAFATCERGRHQSPVDLPVVVDAAIAAAPPVRMEAFHHAHALDIANNGHTVAVTYDDGDRLRLDEAEYPLVQYHFHAPSEHTIAGQHFPLELHLVHAAPSGGLAVVGVLVEYGADNAAYRAIVDNLPVRAGARTHLEQVTVDIDDLLPAARQALAYSGSLTTPPCTEGVRWLVLRTPVALGAAQVERLAEVLHHNSRPVQALNEREFSRTALGVSAVSGTP